MEEHILKKFSENFFVRLAVLFFAGLTVWWITIFYRGLHSGPENNAFTLIYPLFSIFGSVLGLYVSEKWGGFRSLLGKIIATFSFGLLAQFLGQALYAYYIYVQGIQVPYPSLGDIGYFGSVIFYIIAAIYLLKFSGLKFSLKSLGIKLLALAIPLVMLILSYSFFLQGYEFDWTNKMKIFLDFGYPLGQAIYVSIALLALLVSSRMLGGMLKKPILFITAALIFQYCCDFTFLYQANRGTWYVGGVNDYMYCVSYFLMTLALVYIGSIFMKIKES